MADPTVTSNLHELLLALAGRIDDDLLGWARELVAVGEHDEAVELVVGTLLAERTTVPASTRDVLNGLTKGMGVEPDPSAPLALSVGGDAPGHRFAVPGRDAADGGAAPPDILDPAFDAALAEVTERMPAGSQVWLAWRLTPSGGCPGPVPHPVVLVEATAGADDAPEVLAYQVGDAIKRAGRLASVEVFTTSTTVPEYHQAAMRHAELISPMTEAEVGPAAETLAEPAAGPGPDQPLAAAEPVEDRGDTPDVPHTGEPPEPGHSRHGKAPEPTDNGRDLLDGLLGPSVGGYGDYDEDPPSRQRVSRLGTGPAWEPPLAAELDPPSSAADLLAPGPETPAPPPDGPASQPEPWTSPVPVPARDGDPLADPEPGEPREWWRRLSWAPPAASSDVDGLPGWESRVPTSDRPVRADWGSDEPLTGGVLLPPEATTPPHDAVEPADPAGRAERAAAYERQLASLSGLSETERSLLRQLHQELAARESQPGNDREPGVTKMFNGRSRSRRPEPPDLAG